MKNLHLLTYTLLVIGGLNWGLIGFANVNLVSMLFGTMPLIEQGIYALVGLSAVIELVTHKEECRACTEMVGGKKKKK